jgi:hypothetical protein
MFHVTVPVRLLLAYFIIAIITEEIEKISKICIASSGVCVCVCREDFLSAGTDSAMRLMSLAVLFTRSSAH